MAPSATGRIRFRNKKDRTKKGSLSGVGKGQVSRSKAPKGAIERDERPIRNKIEADRRPINYGNQKPKYTPDTPDRRDVVNKRAKKFGASRA